MLLPKPQPGHHSMPARPKGQMVKWSGELGFIKMMPTNARLQNTSSVGNLFPLFDFVFICFLKIRKECHLSKIAFN